MPTTSNFGWTTPADTDLVKDGAAAIRTLGNGIDTSLIDLKGGTTGQNLRKATNTDLDFTWAGDATNTVVDAEGDLLVGDSADTLQRLAIGTTGQVLTVDTAVDGKVKWAGISASPNAYIPTGRNILVRTPSSTYSAQNGLVEDETWYTPVYLPNCTLDRISCLTVSGFSGTATVRLGIYNNGSNNLPTTVLLDAGTVSATGGGTAYSITINQTVNAGLYWLAFNTQTAAATNNWAGGQNMNPLLQYVNSETSNVASYNGYVETGVTGAFATAGTLNFALTAPWTFVRIS